jgi:hypothetical protein
MKSSKVLVSTVLLSLTLSGCGAGNSSYDLGYELGTSQDFASMVLYSDESISTLCRQVVNLSKSGTTNDGIDWSLIDSSDFVQGCMKGHSDAMGK